jgi:TetR/AcrR family transcriptional regulator, lmrAB and yxaGH operons repressor
MESEPMARTHTVSETDLIGRLSLVFRERGYEGASLSDLAEAAGLKKGSLYHRFPRGKAQMAEEVLNAALAWYTQNILEPLSGPGSPSERLSAVARHLDAFYQGGRQACLLNMLSASRDSKTPFSHSISAAFKAVIAAFASLAVEAGINRESAQRRAERTIMLLHGSLVMARGTGSDVPFKSFLNDMQHEMLGGTGE